MKLICFPQVSFKLQLNDNLTNKQGDKELFHKITNKKKEIDYGP